MDDTRGDDSTAIAVIGLFAGTALATMGCLIVGGIGWGLRSAAPWLAVCGLCGCGVGLLLGAVVGVASSRRRESDTGAEHARSFATDVTVTVAAAVGRVFSAIGAYPVHLWPPSREPNPDEAADEPANDGE